MSGFNMAYGPVGSRAFILLSKERNFVSVLFARPVDRSLSLANIRARATQLYTLIAWMHVPAVALIALNARNAWLGPTVFLAIVATVATICAATMKNGLPLRSIMAIALTLAPIAFVYAGRGAMSGIFGHGDWQIDYHMYFFAIFAILVAYVDWRPIVISAGLTAVHHLLLDLVVPSAVFPEEGLDRVALHAICVVAECSVLIWITNTLAALFKRIDEVMDFTTKATAEAITMELEEKAALQAQLDALLTQTARLAG
jgi:methyl-accepting chemotaxis protein